MTEQPKLTKTMGITIVDISNGVLVDLQKGEGVPGAQIQLTEKKSLYYESWEEAEKEISKEIKKYSGANKPKLDVVK